jgi:hypothetical protein
MSPVESGFECWDKVTACEIDNPPFGSGMRPATKEQTPVDHAISP